MVLFPMKVGDVVVWTPTRGAYCPQKVKFVGIVTALGTPQSWADNDDPHVYVIWNESTMPTLNDPRDVKVIEATNESR